MADQICRCGHLKSAHQDMLWVKPETEGEKPQLRWVTEGQGMCSKCSCGQFDNKIS